MSDRLQEHSINSYAGSAIRWRKLQEGAGAGQWKANHAHAPRKEARP